MKHLVKIMARVAVTGVCLVGVVLGTYRAVTPGVRPSRVVGEQRFVSPEKGSDSCVPSTLFPGPMHPPTMC
jgi:hypothetical protein